MDRMRLVGISGHGHHGLLDHERRDGQEFLADVELELDLGPCGAADDIGLTVDYAWVAQAIHDVLTGQPFDLIETVAARCMDVAMSDPRVGAATVTIHKPGAPHTVPVADTQVVIHRGR